MTTTVFEKAYNPLKPFASNDLRYGVKRQMKDKALEMLYIETNSKTAKNLIVADIDSEDSVWELKEKIFDDEILPVPHFITTNPISNHSHIGWFTEGFARSAKQDFVFKSLQNGLNAFAGGDLNFTGGIMRNPLSSLQSSEFFDAPLYSYSDIKGFLPDDYATRPQIEFKGNIDESEGRNCFIFSEARKWAYGAYYKALKSGSESFFYEILLSQVLAMSNELDSPLSNSEVRSIAASINRFLLRSFSLEKAEAKFEAGRAKSLQSRRRKAEEKYLSIKEILNEGHTLKLACDTLGYNYGSIRKSWKQWEQDYEKNI